MSRELRVSDVDACRIDRWYPLFERFTIASRFLPLAQDFVNYLLDDGTLVLPESADPTREKFATASENDSDTEEWQAAAEDEEAAPAKPPPSFPDLEQAIVQAIRELNGAVMPKLTWSAPQDARWISKTGTLRCTQPGDVFLLLKSSECVTYDLQHAYRHCVDQPAAPTQHMLVLRNWYSMDQSREFRCFVVDRQLVAVSQRHASVATPLTTTELEQEAASRLYRFFAEHVIRKFPSADYIADVFLPPVGSPLIVDFNPYSQATDPALFSWEELEDMVAARRSGAPDPSHLGELSVGDGEAVERNPLEAYLNANEAVNSGAVGIGSSRHLAMGVALRLQREASQLGSASFAWQAFPRDVVEIAGTGSVQQMIEAMRQAQARDADEDDDEEDDDGDSDAEEDDESDKDADGGMDQNED